MVFQLESRYCGKHGAQLSEISTTKLCSHENLSPHMYAINHHLDSPFLLWITAGNEARRGDLEVKLASPRNQVTSDHLVGNEVVRVHLVEVPTRCVEVHQIKHVVRPRPRLNASLSVKGSCSRPPRSPPPI